MEDKRASTKAGIGTMTVLMEVRGLILDPVSNTPIVILKDQSSDTLLPIWVGLFEANAIALQMENVRTPRPMTHDLLKTVIDQLDARVESVVIDDLRDNTFFAKIRLVRDVGIEMIDSRPSDAIALALRTSSPILVEDDVISQACAAGSETDSGAETERIRRWLEGIPSEELGKYKM